MPSEKKQGYPVVAISVLLLVLFLLGGLWFLIANAVASGGATLPNGSRLSIESDFRGFGIAERGKSTEVDIGGLHLEFRESKIFVDGDEVAVIDDSVKQHNLTAKGAEVILVSGDKTIFLSD